MTATVIPNKAGLAHILQVEAAPLVQQTADLVEASISAAVGTIDGHPVDIDRHDNDTPDAARWRAALVLKHPTRKGRQAANDAARAALQVSS